MYATINVSCFAVAFLGTPGFRPTWRCFHWSSALLGCLLCLGLMFAISWLYSLVALAFGAGVGFYVRITKSQHGLGRRGSGFPVPSGSRSVTSINREINVSPREELAAANFVLCLS